MSLTWVIIGSIAQLMLAGFLFMLVAFSAGGIVNNGSIKPFQLAILNLFIYLLPASCLVSAGVVIYQYRHGGDAQVYWWYLLPVIAAVIYLVFAIKLNK